MLFSPLRGVVRSLPRPRGGQPIQIGVDGSITLDEASLARMAVLEDVGIGFFMESDVQGDLAAGAGWRVARGWQRRPNAGTERGRR